MKRIKRKRVHTGGAKIDGLPFMGEVMNCAICHKKQKSDPKVESDWTMVQLGSTKIYLCPVCFGNGIFSEKHPETTRP